MDATRIFDMKPLFEDVQLGQVFPDGKTFVDCIPKTSLNEIGAAYASQKGEKGFDLREFILEHFSMPTIYAANFKADTSREVESHIEFLWDVLTRQPDSGNGSLIPLPYPYIVPGGRFGEIYYWDSYFTMLGLKAAGRYDMVENMVKNFSYLIETIGYIPNGNRSYYIGRSQPPFYSMMIELLAEIRGKEILVRYLPQMVAEYLFWMDGAEELRNENTRSRHLVRMPGGEMLNRYWDSNATPRPEAFREDLEMAHHSKDSGEMFRHLRAGAASGWDFSSRWFQVKEEFSSIHTTDIVPVDLNCLLFHLEELLAEAFLIKGDNKSAAAYQSLADIRKAAIIEYCWNAEKNFFFDFDSRNSKQTEHETLAAGFPLCFGIATNAQAKLVSEKLENRFLQPGGLTTTLNTTGQQWDAPNGWAPLQWIAITGLQRYGQHELSREIKERWIQLNRKVFRRTGKLMEKYNVVDTDLEAGGGEYPGQDGFGWTNGVFLALTVKGDPT